jgi:hypothetical protein
MHDRGLTADNMSKKNWPCNEFCSLCFCIHETTSHLLIACNFTEAVWNLVANKFHLLELFGFSSSDGPVGWVSFLTSSGSTKQKRRKLGILFTFWWRIWKERNRRVFEQLETSTFQLAELIYEDNSLLQPAGVVQDF